MMEPSQPFDLESRTRRSALSFAPLIDATFILLIFFMLVSQFGRLVPVELSISRETARLQTAQGEPSRIIRAELVLHADGAFMVNGRHFAAVTGLEQVIDLVEKFFAGEELREVTGQPMRSVVLMPEPDVRLQQLIDVLIALKARPHISVSIVAPAQAGE